MNNRKTIREVIDSRLASLTLGDEFSRPTINTAVKPGLMRRPLGIAAAVCLCIALALPVMAATIPSFNRLVSLVSPQIAQKLQPIELVSVSNGIRMEVVAAMNDDDTVVVYLTMQDLTGNRIDESMNLLAGFSISGANMLTSEIVDFDAKTKTATLRLMGSGGDQLEGQKVTVRINSFMSGKNVYREVDPGVDLTALLQNPETTALAMNNSPGGGGKLYPSGDGARWTVSLPQAPETTVFDMNNSPGGGGELYPILREQGTIEVLKKDALRIPLPGIDFAEISNIGRVDGRLHVQVRWSCDGVENNGYLYLTDAAGNMIYPSNVSLNYKAEGTSKYEENIFELDKTELGGLKLKGYFVSYDRQTEGNWQTTFKIEAVTKAQEAACDIETANMKITRVAISPLGITIMGSGKAPDPDTSHNLAIAAIMTGGKRVDDFDTTNTLNENGKIIIKYMPGSLLDVKNVRAVDINGTTIDFKQ
jgi:hypothetical protein